jgi:hypothetical protein
MLRSARAAQVGEGNRNLKVPASQQEGSPRVITKIITAIGGHGHRHKLDKNGHNIQKQPKRYAKKKKKISLRRVLP